MDEKFILDYNETIGFRGITISFPYLEERFNYVSEHRIKDVCVIQDTEEKRVVDFSFLRGFEFIETFHWLVDLSKKSNVNGIYFLSKLKNMRWIDSFFRLDFSQLSAIEILNLPYQKNLHFEYLPNLRELYLNSVKAENLSFLPNLEKLETLRLLWGQFASLHGLEQCKNLKKLNIGNCYKLSDANTTLQKLKHLECVVITSCKKHDVDVSELMSRVNHVYIE